MKTRKRLLAIILTWVMILSTLPVSAAGESAPSAKGAGIPGLKEIKISSSPRPDARYHLGDMGRATAVWENEAAAKDLVWSAETPDDTVEITIDQSSGEFTVMKAQVPPGGEEGTVPCTIKATARIDGTDYTETRELKVYRSHALSLSPYRNSVVVTDRKLLRKPKKIFYEAGEYLDLTGMVIEFIYDDGKKWTSVNGADCELVCKGWDEIEKRPLELTDEQLVVVPDHLYANVYFNLIYINIFVKEGTERAVELDVGSNGTASVSPPSSKPGSDIKITAVPNEGYVLDKITWKPEDGSEKNITESASFTMPAKKAFVKVRFKPAPRTVRFMDGEEVLFSQAVEYGQQAAKPASDPEKNGCEFAGWYADPAYSQAFDFNQDIRSDTPVYAKFKMRTTMSIRVPDKPLDVEEWMDAYFTVSPDLNPTERIILLPDLFTVKAGDQDLGSFYDPVRAKPELMWSFTASELGVGTHTISVSYGGNNKYTGCSGSFTVNVIEKESMQVVDFSPQTAPVNTAYTVSGRILDESGNPIANKSMSVVNQVGYGVTGKTDQDGRFSVVMNRDIPSEHGKTIEIKVVSSANDSYKRLISPHSIQFIDGYTVSASCDPEAGGKISITNTSPTTQGKEFFAEGETVSLKITKNPGYTFDGLTVNGETVTNIGLDFFGGGGYTASFPMPGKAAEVKAKFTGGGSGTTTYRVTVTGGRVNGSILGRVFAEGDTVTVTADSVSGQTFKEWSGAEGLSFTSGSASSSTASFKMPARDVTLTATYENGGTTTYPVTLVCEPAVGGSISIRTVSPTTQGKEFFAEGETVSLKITDNPGYTFDGLTVNGETVTNIGLDFFGGGGYTASFPMPGKAAEVKATFTGGGSGTTTYHVTVTGGRVNGSILGRVFAEGDTVTVTADSVSGQTFKEWSGADGLSFTAGSARSRVASFTMPARDVTLTATYEGGGSGFTINRSASPSWAGELRIRTKIGVYAPDDQTTFPAGSSITLDVTANKGYEFMELLVDGSKVDAVYNVAAGAFQYVFTLQSNVNAVAYYKAVGGNDTYAVSVSADPAVGGDVVAYHMYDPLDSDSSVVIDEGADATVKATPKTGYSFEGWYDGTTPVSTDNPYTFTPAGDITLTAKFTPAPTTYPVTLICNPKGCGEMEIRSLLGMVITKRDFAAGEWISLNVYVYGESNKLLRVTVNEEEEITATPYGAPVGEKREYHAEFQMPAKAVTVTAYYSGGGGGSGAGAKSYTVSVQADPVAGGSVTGGGMVEKGQRVTATATANTGYVFGGWYKGTELVSPDNPYTFTPTGDITLTARFRRKLTEGQGGFQLLKLDTAAFQNYTSDFVYLSYTEFSDTAYNKSFPLDPSQLSLYVDGVQLAADYHLHESLGPCFKLEGRTLPAGEHSFQLRWAGDESYAPHDSNVYRATHKMRVRAVYDNPSGVVYRGEGFVLRLLENQTGTPLKNAAVTLTLNGVDYTKTTDEEGFAKLNIDVDPGEYTITATYQGDETHYPLNQAYPVQVRWRVRMIKEYASPIYSRQGEGLKIRLLDDQSGTPIGSGRIVSFTVNGVNYTRETDEEGVALLKINLPPGMYSATASFEGQQLSDTFEVRSRVRVVTYDLAKAYGSPDQFKATLLDDIDETPVAGQTVLFNINGVFYKKVSNDDGVAALPIRLLPGEYIITTTYNGIDRANRVIVTESIYPPQPRYAVSVSISPGEGGQVSGGGDFAGGESATLTAAPNEGYRFVGWSRGGVQVSSDNPYRFTVTENRYLTAVFQERSASCTVKTGFAPLSLSGHIQVSGAGTYPEGSQITLSASLTGPENRAFLGWVDNDSNTIISRENPYRFTVLQDMNLTAVFGAVSAPLVTSYPLWVGDTQVDEANKDNIPGVTGENAKASFDPATNTLTLENVTGVSGSTMGALITAEGIDLTVTGSAVLEDNTVDMGIQVAPGSLTLEGDFTITAGSYGIYVQKNVTMVGGRLFAKGGACGIYSARGDLKVKSGTLEAEGSMWALGTAPDLSGYTGEYEVLVKENYNAAAGAGPWDGDFNHNPLGGSSSLYKYVKIAPRSSQPAEKYHINIVAPPEVTLSYTALSEDGAWGNPKYDTPIAEAAAGQDVLVFAQVDQSHYDFAGSDTLRLLGSNQILQDWNNPATHIFLNYFEMPANDVTVVILPVRKTNDGMGEMARCCIWLDGDESILDEQWIYSKNMPAPEKLEDKTGKVPVKADDAGGSYVFDHWDYEQEGDWRITFKPVFSSAPVGVPSCKLLSITADGGTLEPAFDPEVTAYTITVPYEREEIGLVAEDDTCLRIDESEWKPNSLQLSYNPGYPTEITKAEGRIALEVGENVVHLTASYINGVLKETEYTVTIKRAAPPPRTVTFQVINGSWEDGSDKKQLTVPEGTKLTAAEIPAGTPDSGFGAGTWDTDPVGQTVSGDVTFTWTYRHFKIRYEMVGDVAIGTPPAERQTEWWGTESREVLGGSALLVRPAILNEQYDFGGIWYTDQACTQQVDGWAALDGDVTLYGAWTGPYNTVIDQVMLNFVPPVAGDPIPAGQYYADGIGAGIPAELGVTQPGSMDDKTLVYFAAYELEGGEEEAVFEAGKTCTLRVILGLADPLSQRFKGHGGGTPYALSVTGAEGSIAFVAGTQTEVQLAVTPVERYSISSVVNPSEAGSISFADALAGGNAITAAKAGETIYIILPQAGGGYMALDLICQGDSSGREVTVDMFKFNDRIYRASFMMPEEPVTVTASFVDIAAPRKITVVCEPERAGTASASQEEGVYGDMIRLTASAQEGWLFDKWQIVSGAGADLVSAYGLEGIEEQLRMGYEDVSLKALFVEDTRPIVHIILEAPLCGVRPAGASSLPSGAPVYTYQTPRPEATLLTQGWSFATYAENGENMLGWSAGFTGWSSNATSQAYPFKGGGTYTVYGKLISDGSEDLSQGVRVFAGGREGAARVDSGGIVTFYVTVEAVHDWDEPQYDWAGDDSSVSGKVCCRNAACGETLQETVNTTKRITAQATETACAEMSYTAVFTQQPFTTQTKTVLIPKTPLNLGLTISGWTEGEMESQPLLNGNDGKGAVTYSYRLAADPDEEASYRAGLPAVAGDYVLRARVAETVTHQAGEAFAAFTISRAKFTVTYVVENGSWGDGTTTVKTEEVEEGQNPAQIPTGMLPAVNYEGGSWDTDPSGAVITDNATFTYSFTEQKPPAPPKTVFTITFDLDGGTWDGQTGSVSLKVEDGTDIILPEPEKAGYTFDYWEGSRYNAGDRYTVGGDHTFTARWKQNSVTPGGDQPGGDQPGGDQPGGDQPGGDQPGGDQPGGDQPGGDQPGGNQPGGDQPGGDQPGGDQPGGDQPGGDQPGGDQPGGDQPGGDQPGGDQPGGDQPGGDQPGGDQPGGDQPGGDQPGGDQPGGDQPGGDQPGGDQPGGDQPGGDQPGGDQPGGDQPGGDQPGGDQPGGDQPGGDQPGGDQPGGNEPGGDQPGGNEPGGDQPGGDQPGGDQPGGDQPGGDEPGGDQPGGDQPGGDQPGGDQPGGDEPGGDQPGGDQPGGDQPGGDQPGGDQPGGDQPGGDQPGGDQPGGDQPGGDQPGGDQPGGDQPGGDQPGGDQPGGDQPGGNEPGGDQPGGDQPGGDQPGEDQPGGDQPGGDQPGGDQPGGDQPGGDQPGGDQPGGDQPGGDQPGGDQPGGDQPGGDQPGGDQPGGDQPGGDQPGGDQPGGDEPGGNEPGGDQPGGDEPGGNEPGGDQPGGDEPGGNEPGGDQPGGDEPGGNEPGGDQPGGNEPGGDHPGGDKPGGDQPGGDQPGGDQPGGDQPGGDQPGGDQPGGDQPGGDQPGGDQPGGDQPGGDQPGGDQPGGDEPGGDQPGGDQPGGDQPGGDQPGGDQPGGDEPGGDQPGGDQPGGDQPGGDQPGGDQPGGDQPGGDQPGGDQPGGDQPGGDEPGGDQPGGDQPGGDQPGGDQPGGDQPGGDQPGGDQPGGDQPGGDQPGGNEPGGNEPGGNEPGGNEPGGNEPGGNEPGGNEPGGNEPGGDQPGGDQPGGDQPGGDQPGGDQPGGNEPGGSDPTQEESTLEEPTQEEPTQEEPTQEEPTQEEPTQEEPTQEEPTQEDPTQNMPGKSIPAMGDGNSLTKWIALLSISLLGLAVIWPGTDKKESKRRSR